MKNNLLLLEKTDVYSLGCIAYELILNNKPFLEYLEEELPRSFDDNDNFSLLFVHDNFYKGDKQLALNEKEFIKKCTNRNPELRIGIQEAIELLDKLY